jgi:hypothetical protein
MTNLRFTSGDDPILVAMPGNTYLGGSGDDRYILDPNFVQAGDTININDRDGANVIHLVDGLNIVSSQLATLDSGVTQMQLTLANATRIFIDGASTFSYQMGGSNTEASASGCTFAQLAQSLGYTTIPAPGDQAQIADPVTIGAQGGCGRRTIWVDATTPPSDASTADCYFDIQPGDYSHPIAGFGSGDVLAFPEGNTPTLQNDSFTDGTAILNWADDGGVVQIALTGLSASADAQLLQLSDFTSVFGDAALV